MKRIFLFFGTLILLFFISNSGSAINYKGGLETNNEVVFPEQTTPGNPAAGKQKLYFKSDDKAYSLNSGGSEIRLGFPDAIVDGDISEAEGFLRKTGAGAYEGIKSNLGATTDPDPNEDSNDGYAVGSVWINVTLDKVFRAVDVTVASAVWKDLSAAGAGGGLTLRTEQATTSGTEFDFTGIPTGVLRVTVIFRGVSLSGTDAILCNWGMAVDLKLQIIYQVEPGPLEQTGLLKTIPRVLLYEVTTLIMCIQGT